MNPQVLIKRGGIKSLQFDTPSSLVLLWLLLAGIYPTRQVELEGVEPSSKQGNHTLSTCLFQPSVFVLRQDPDHQSQPYPLKFHHTAGARHDYFRFNCTAWPKSFGTTAFERCLVLLPCSWIKPIIYYTSIRQREHNCFRQINF